MLPSIQVNQKNEKVTVFWDITPGFKSYKLYWSPTGQAGSYNELKRNIPNTPNYAESKKKTSYSFNRSSIGLTEFDSFYIALSGVNNNNIETTLGTPRPIHYISDQPVSEGANHSPITRSENLSVMVGVTPVVIDFSQDIILIEIFNNSSSNILYVEVTGFEADSNKSMPIYPLVYYTIFRNLTKGTGISLVAGSGSVDARIVGHY